MKYIYIILGYYIYHSDSINMWKEKSLEISFSTY